MGSYLFVNATSGPLVQTPGGQAAEAKFSKQNEFPSTVAEITSWASHWEQSIIMLPLKLKETRPGLEGTGCRPGEKPCGEEYGGRDSSSSKAPALYQMLYIHSSRDHYAHFTDVGTEAQQVKPLAQDQEAKASGRSPPSSLLSLPSPPTPHSAPLAAFCGKQHPQPLPT